MENGELRILYEDRDLIVCHKPAGIAVQSASVREKDMVSILKNGIGGEIYVVHRLDQPVEGVMVFARTKRAASDLGVQAQNGGMRKIYQAVCEVQNGVKIRVGQTCTLIDYLETNGKDNCSFVVDRKDPKAKRAQLSYRILKSKYTGIQVALAEIELETGRHHQIRVQMAHAGLPLRGDRKYNPAWSKESDHAQDKETLLALCATSLTLKHPTSKKKMTFETKPAWEEIKK